MAVLVIKDRVLETSTSTGTGDFTLSGAVLGFKAFSAVCSVGDFCYYMIEGIDANGAPSGEWETGFGTYSAANTLTRTTVHDSSNSGSAVSFSAGSKRVSLSTTAKSELWVPVASWAFSVGGLSNIDLVDLGGYSQLLVFARNLGLSSSGIRSIYASVDNGASFFTASGDYNNITTAGTETVRTTMATHSTAITNLRSVYAHIINNNMTTVPKIAWTAEGPVLFAASLSPINAIRVAASAGTFTAGTVDIIGKI